MREYKENFGSQSSTSVTFPLSSEKGCFRIRTQIAALPLVEGVYTLGLYLVTEIGLPAIYWKSRILFWLRALSFKGFPPYHAELLFEVFSQR